ncbi:MAG: DMT superfamily drug/metabolite transporter [Idiomarinaceae bacterium HL-53]|nr:MAG: DMT superfamily drug/metabolite transporter [Idiomarinaceae bacterium HL-53]CUS48446.1 EamA-like transporter family protein [Idiomarinaceae bacterium HL-53]
MRRSQIVIFTTLALLAFAGNSILCRLALATTSIDPASFTTLRLISGALALWFIVLVRSGFTPTSNHPHKNDWQSAIALFIYAAAFSFAYVSLATGTGALMLFGAVQATMISAGIWRGERFNVIQIIGFFGALIGLIGLLLPGATAPSLHGGGLMLIAGIAWGVYSLRGKKALAPTLMTTRNFMLAAPLSVLLSFVFIEKATLDSAGAYYAILSGAVTSGVGYAIWYAVLPSLRATHAATLQLSVPVIAAIFGITFLNELISMRLVAASLLILGGIALVVLSPPRARLRV